MIIFKKTKKKEEILKILQSDVKSQLGRIEWISFLFKFSFKF